MMKGDSRLNHCLQKKLFFGTNFPHPAFFPGVVRRMKFTGIVEIDSGDVLNRIGKHMHVVVELSFRRFDRS